MKKSFQPNKNYNFNHNQNLNKIFDNHNSLRNFSHKKVSSNIGNNGYKQNYNNINNKNDKLKRNNSNNKNQNYINNYLSQRNNDILFNNNYNHNRNNINHFPNEKYLLDYNNNEITQKDFNEELLKIFINIFYYEKYLTQNKEKVFDDNEKYYLINPQWLQMYKNYYNYDKLNKLLKTKQRNSMIKYNNLDKNYKFIIKEVKNKYLLYFDRKELSEDLLDIKQINCFLIRQKNILFIKEGVIFPSKIIELIKQIHKNISKFLVPKDLYFRKNNIIYINKYYRNIVIGNLNSNNIFIPKYVFNFNSIDNLEKEKNKILSNSFSINKLKEKSKQINNNINLGIFKYINNEDIIKPTTPYKDIKLSKIPKSEEKNIPKRDLSNINLISKSFVEEKNSRNNFSKFYENQIQNEVNSIQNSFINYQNTKDKESEKEEGDFLENQEFLNKDFLEIKTLINEKKEMENKINELKQNECNLKKELESKNEELKEYKNKYNYLNNNYLDIKEELEKYKIEMKKYENEQIKNKDEQLKKRETEIIKNEENYNNIDIDGKELKIFNYADIQNIMISIIEKIQIKNIEQKKVIEQLKEIILKEPLFFYSKPVLIGLKKIGHLNYMNSIIQCLSQTKNLTNYFLIQNQKLIINNNIELQNKRELLLTPIYLELIKQLWPLNKTEINFYSPNHFINRIEKINPTFKSGQKCNAKKIIIFILEQLHKELKKNINSNNNIINNFNIYDKKSVLNNFLIEFQKEKSIISDLFFGINETTTLCLNCIKNENSQIKNVSITYNYEIFKYIIFPLEEIKKNFIGYNEINKKITIKDCFNFNQRDALLNEEKKFICKNCQQSNYVFNSKIYSSPDILILVIERGKENIYLDIKENIDITEFVLKKDKPKLIYELYGVITQLEFNNSNSQFIASCKNPIDNKWYRFNNENIKLIENIKDDICEFKFTYILFYEKNNK